MIQEAFAAAKGISQQAVSIVENSGTIQKLRLQDVAKVLGVTLMLLGIFLKMRQSIISIHFTIAAITMAVSVQATEYSIFLIS